LIEILSNANEFELIPIRNGDDKVLKALNDEIPYRLEKPKYNEP